MFSHCRSISNFNLGNFTSQIKQVDEDDELVRIADNSYNTEQMETNEGAIDVQLKVNQHHSSQAIGDVVKTNIN